MSNNIYPNWFDMTARDNFARFLLPEAGKDHYKALQIGAFVGHASRWLCKYILTGKGAMLTDVDTWQGSDEKAHSEWDWNDVYNAYIENLYPYHFRRVNHHRITSDVFFENLSNLPPARIRLCVHRRRSYRGASVPRWTAGVEVFEGRRHYSVRRLRVARIIRPGVITKAGSRYVSGSYRRRMGDAA